MRTLVIAPHPDDELLGPGGTLLRRKFEGAELAWVIVTAISTETGWDEKRVKQRSDEIQQVTRVLGFDQVYSLGFPTASLDRVPVGDLVSAFSRVFKEFEPEEVFLPHPSDVHTDHRIVFDAAAGCTKWFRYPSVKRVLAYETLSETDFGLTPGDMFKPNLFIDIEPFLDAKLELLNIYKSELGEFPFPRSHDSLRALATLRGSASGYKAAEAFELLRERY